jgi:hypothetical protein
MPRGVRIGAGWLLGQAGDNFVGVLDSNEDSVITLAGQF